MDDAHFRALIGDLSLTADIRLSDLANRDYHTFSLLRTKMLEIMAERNELERVDLDVSNARERMLDRALGRCKHGKRLVPGCEDCLRKVLQQTSAAESSFLRR
jgi:hypothetical protein